MIITKDEIDKIFADDNGEKLMSYIIKFNINDKFKYEDVDKDIVEEYQIMLDALNETFEYILKHIEKEEIKISAINLESLIKDRKILLTDYPYKQNTKK